VAEYCPAEEIAQWMFRSTFIFLYGFFGILTAVYLIATTNKYHYTEFDVESLHWLKAWFYASLVNYYGLALSLSVFIVASEPFSWGFFWMICLLLFGSPVACFYVVYRLYLKNVVLIDEPRAELQGIGYERIIT
jgi:hypothetical protein